MEQKVNKQVASKFIYGNSEIYLSAHAYKRTKERFNLNTHREVDWKINQILVNGIEEKNYLTNFETGKKIKERVIIYEDTSLHIRDNTITTIKHYFPHYGCVHQKRSFRSLNRKFR